MKFYGHTAFDNAGRPNFDKTLWQPLKAHLLQVANKAREFGHPLKMADEAEVAGLLHDLGKYSERFQKRLSDPTIHGINHWAAGTAHACQSKWDAVAFAIDGHHTGLPSRDGLKQVPHWWKDPKIVQKETGCLELLPVLLSRFTQEGLHLPSFSPSREQNLFAIAQRIRFLFSCLVDADFLDTEDHFQPLQSKERVKVDLDAPRALSIVLEHLKRLGNQSPPSPLNHLRTKLLDDCLTSAERPKSLFTLTAPTGSGKTLASLAFALKHIATRNEKLPIDDPMRLRRVIVVIPYTSIIEQTAQVYRNIFEEHFGPDYILEHHSSVEVKEGKDSQSSRELRARLATQNWDAPLVVTTSVQFFGSLFSNRPSACRKLHNIARSVILFDEVQTLPPQLIPSLLSGVKLLTQEPYGSTVVFMTATQPAFVSAEKDLEPQGWAPAEISSNPRAMAETLRRTSICLPKADESISWKELADQLCSQRQGLVVVNTTKDARNLFQLIRDRNVGMAAHLSSRLCPAHRKEKLQSIRSALLNHDSIHLVSTQLIEAGVDIDFPIAFRALGPLDSIIQTAGRCNREGRHETPCPVIVFRPIDGSLPPGAYKTASQATEQFLNRHPDAEQRLHDPDFYTSYFRELYGFLKQKDEVLDALKKLDFPLASEKCKIIDQDTRAVLVRWGRGEYLIEKLKREHHLTANECREAQRYSVNIYQHEFIQGQAEGFIDQPSSEWEFYAWASHYDEDLGASHLTAEYLIG